MTVSSGRVQELVVGDDVILTHQIVAPVALNAEVSLAPVLVNSGDTVNFFYPLQTSFGADLIGYPGVHVGSFPSSTFTVAIPGLIVADPPTPQRGTVTFQQGFGLTVRAEITRVGGSLETHYLYQELDVYQRGFPQSPAANNLNLT